MENMFSKITENRTDTSTAIPMKKKLPLSIILIGVVAVLLIVLIIILFIVNANKKKTTNAPTSSTNPNITNSNVTLAYWGLWEPEQVMKPIIEKFEQENPGVKIQYSQQRFSGYESRTYSRLRQSTSSSEPSPDILRIHNTWLPKYIKYLSSVPTNIMSKEEYSQKFYPTALEDFTGKDGKLYAIPWEIDGLMVFYNKQMLSKKGVNQPPADWDSFIELANNLTTKDSSGKIQQSGLAMGSAENIKHAAEIISFLLLQNNVNIIDETRTTVSLNNSRAISVFEMYTNFAKGENAIWSPSSRSDLEMFYSGKLAMMIAPSWRVFDIIKANSTIEFGTAPLPQLIANENEIYYSTYWGDTVSKDCKNPEIAWKFIKFLSEREQQLQLFSSSVTNNPQDRVFGEPYSLVELNSEMAKNPYLKPMATMAPFMKSWQMGDETAVKKHLDEAVTSIIKNNTSVESALRKAEENINKQLAQTNK